MELILKHEVYNIVGFCIEIWKTLGYGFSEVVYKDAMQIELSLSNISYKRQEELAVFYKGKKLKYKFKADFSVIDEMIIEVKSGEDGINNEMIAQTLNYLKASGFRVELIMNFGRTKMGYKRLVM